MIIDEEVFLEHYGVKGQKWGQRRQRRAQSQVDTLKRVSKGQAKGRDKRVAGSLGVLSKKGAARTLRRLEKKQKVLEMNRTSSNVIRRGSAHVTTALHSLQGVSMKDLNFSQTG